MIRVTLEGPLSGPTVEPAGSYYRQRWERHGLPGTAKATGAIVHGCIGGTRKKPSIYRSQPWRSCTQPVSRTLKNLDPFDKSLQWCLLAHEAKIFQGYWGW